MNRKEILRSAGRTLAERPNASLAAIAEAAGIGRATLHRHFAGRAALLRELAQTGLDSWSESLDAVDVERLVASDDAEAVRAGVVELIRSGVRIAIQGGVVMTAPELEDVPELVALNAHLVARERRLHERAQQLGVLRSDVPSVWIGWTLFGLLVAARDSVRFGDSGSRAVEDLVIDQFFRGSGAR